MEVNMLLIKNLALFQEIVQEQQELITYLLQENRPELEEANQRIKDKIKKLSEIRSL